MTSALIPSIAVNDVCDLLCFDIGAERFAMPLANVEEVVDGCGVNVAVGKSAMVGVMRVRHELLAVFEASRVLQTSRTHSEPVALVLPSSRGLVSLLVDSAEAAPQVSLAAMRMPPALSTEDRVLDGVLRVGARWVALINSVVFVEALIADAIMPPVAGNYGN